MSKKAFVTGATGFVGSSLAKHLSQQGWQLVALVRTGSHCNQLEELGITLVYGDITNPDSYREAISGCDLVFHCAALTGVGHKIKQFWHVISEGTRAVLSAAKMVGVKRFIHVSSIVAYELNNHVTQYDESQALINSSIDPYGQAKASAESLCLAAHQPGKFAVSVVRPVFVYGPGDRPGGFLPTMAALLKAEKFRLMDNGNNPLPLVYITDLIELLVLCANSDQAGGQVYNANSNDSPTWQQFAEKITSECNLPSPKSVSSRLLYPVASILETFVKLKLLKTLPLSKTAVKLMLTQQPFPADKAINELGYQPKVGFQKGMENSLPMVKAFLHQDNL